MMESLWHFLSTAAPETLVATDGKRAATAGRIRAAARRVTEYLGAGEAPVVLYCEDAANFIAGFAGALAAGREVRLPGHAAPDYLREIGAGGAAFVSDLYGVNAIPASVCVPDEADAVLPPLPDGRVSFFTSGSSGEPKLCMKSLHQLAAEVEVLRRQWGAPDGAVAGTVSHQHIYGMLFRVLWPLSSGARIFFAATRNMGSGGGVAGARRRHCIEPRPSVADTRCRPFACRTCGDFFLGRTAFSPGRAECRRAVWRYPCRGVGQHGNGGRRLEATKRCGYSLDAYARGRDSLR